MKDSARTDDPHAPGEQAVPRVLLVDDRPENLMTLEGILAEEDYELHQVTSGEAALREVLRYDFAAIVMDVAMPGLDGVAAASLIKQRPRCRTTPILFVTASLYDVEQVVRGYAAGAADYLHKPLNPEVVRAKLAVFVGLFHERAKLELSHARTEAGRHAVMAKVEAALAVSEARYEAAVRDAPFGVAVLDEEGHWLRANAYLSELTGYPPGELPALPTLIASDDPAAARTVTAALAGDRHDLSTEVVLRHRDGRAVWTALVLSRLAGAEDGPVTALIEDVTGRRLQETCQRLLSAASEALMGTQDCRTTLPQVASMVVPALADWCVIDIVGDGPEPDETVALTHRAPDRVAAVRALKRNLLGGPRGGVEVVAERALNTPEGAARARAAGWLAPPAVPGSDAALPRALMRVPIVANDVLLGTITVAVESPARSLGSTERACLEELARRCALALTRWQMFAAARAAATARDEFISIASHELRTPLTPLRLDLRRLGGSRRRARRALDPAHAAQVVRRCERQVARLDTLVANLIDIARIGAGQLSLDVAPVDLGNLVEEVASRFNEEGEVPEAEIRIEALPSAVGRWDRVRLEQVVSNLLTNAVRYGQRRPITVTMRRDGGWVELGVRDQGIGIAPERLETIFGRFERAVSVRAYGGLGLGLFLVRQILRAHGGDVRVESTLGVGSTFTVRLPLAQGTQRAAAS